METRKIGINGYCNAMNSTFADDMLMILPDLTLADQSNHIMVKLVDDKNNSYDNTYLIKSRTLGSLDIISKIDFTVIPVDSYNGCADWKSRRNRTQELLKEIGNKRNILIEIKGWKTNENRSGLVRA